MFPLPMPRQATETLPFLRPREEEADGAVLVDVDGLTDRGCVRERNEDQFLIADLNRQIVVRKTGIPGVRAQPRGGTQGVLLMVADGMGGHGGGDLASSVAVDVMVSYMTHVMPWFWGHGEDHARDVIQHLGPALAQCQDRLEAVAARKGLAHHRPGTTLTVGYVLDSMLYLVHVGDSRCYVHREGTLHQLTSDHTLAQKMACTEGVPLDQVRLAHRLHHVLINTIGGDESEPEPEIKRLPLQRGDVLLLCTDGLTRHVPDARIAARLAEGARATDCCQALIDDAKRAGGRDNITAVVCRM